MIGAGYTGPSAALELAQAGFKVVVLEAENIGYGASGRNGGQVCTGFSSGQQKIISQLGKDDAGKCFALAEVSKALLKQRITEHKIDCDLAWGYMHVVPKPHLVEELKAWRDEYAALGVSGMSLLDKHELEKKLGSTIYHGALRESGAGSLNPSNYCRGLAGGASKAGGVATPGAWA